MVSYIRDAIFLGDFTEDYLNYGTTADAISLWFLGA